MLWRKRLRRLIRSHRILFGFSNVWTSYLVFTTNFLESLAPRGSLMSMGSIFALIAMDSISRNEWLRVSVRFESKADFLECSPINVFMLYSRFRLTDLAVHGLSPDSLFDSIFLIIFPLWIIRWSSTWFLSFADLITSFSSIISRSPDS